MERKKIFFTLVELLVVIAVIAILLTLLFPGLKSARDAAKRLSCMGNLKQTAYACQMYVSDYQRYPTPNCRPANTDGDQAVRWYRALLPYMAPNCPWPPGTTESYGLTRAAALAAWACPSCPYKRVVGTTTCMHYGMSESFDNSSTASGGYICVPQNYVAKNGAVVFADRMMDWTGMLSKNSGANSRPDPRHLGNTANFSFVDGHVSSIKLPEYFNSVYWTIH